MGIQQILTRRFNPGQNYALPIIYEWENEISREIGVPVRPYPSLYRYVNF